MFESRAIILKKKPKVVLDKRFPNVRQLNLGDRGQMLMGVLVDEERLEFQEDGTERIIKRVRAVKVEILDNKPARI